MDNINLMPFVVVVHIPRYRFEVCPVLVQGMVWKGQGGCDEL